MTNVRVQVQDGAGVRAVAVAGAGAMAEHGQATFRAVLGLKETVAIAVGTTIGAGVFALTPIAARYAGPALPLAYLLAALPVAVSLVPIAALAAALPTSGGNYRYPSRLLGPGVAFLGVWCYALGAFFGCFPLYALTGIDYLAAYLPALGPGPGGAITTAQRLAAAGVLTLFYAVNCFGIVIAARVEAGMVAVMLAALLLYDVAGLPAVDLARYDGFFQQGAGGIARGASYLVFAYMGANALIELGAEIRDPGRTIPRAFAVSLPIIALIYVGMGVVTVGVEDWAAVAGLRSGVPRPLGAVAARFLPEAGVAFFVIGGALLAIITTLHGTFIWGTRSLVVLCADGLLPSSWGALHPRFRTPVRLLTGVWLLSLAGLAMPVGRETLAAYATVGGLCILVPVLFAAVRLPARFPAEHAAASFRPGRGWLRLSSAVGVVLCVGAMADLLGSAANRVPLLFFTLWVGLGVLHYRWARARNPAISALGQRRDF